MKNLIRNIATAVMVFALIVCVSVLATATNTVKVQIRGTSPTTGFGAWTYFQGTLAASADTAILPLTSVNSRDSAFIVVYNYTTGGARTALRVHWQGSMNAAGPWTEQTFGTDSTTFSTTATTLAGAKVNTFWFSPLTYYNFPYQRLLLFVPTTGNTETTKYQVHHVRTISGR